MEGIPGVTSQRLSRVEGDELLGGSFLSVQRRSKEREVRGERRRGDRGVRGRSFISPEAQKTPASKMMRSAEAVVRRREPPGPPVKPRGTMRFHEASTPRKRW